MYHIKFTFLTTLQCMADGCEQPHPPAQNILTFPNYPQETLTPPFPPPHSFCIYESVSSGGISYMSVLF